MNTEKTDKLSPDNKSILTDFATKIDTMLKGSDLERQKAMSKLNELAQTPPSSNGQDD